MFLLSCVFALGYLLLWPHARPWRFSRPQPMLRALPGVAQVAETLAAAVAAHEQIALDLPGVHQPELAAARHDRNLAQRVDARVLVVRLMHHTVDAVAGARRTILEVVRFDLPALAVDDAVALVLVARFEHDAAVRCAERAHGDHLLLLVERQ